MTKATRIGSFTRVAGAVALAGLALALRPDTAEACGGLFCNSSQPVNQAAERIIFANNGDGTVTAVIEIKYEGPAEKFAWVLPVPGVPDVEISSVTAFDRLQQATNPQYALNRRFEECGDGPNGGIGRDLAAPSADGASAGGGGTGGNASPVTVLAAGSVGPFDYKVIKVDAQLSDPAQVALDWLMTNGYDVTDLGPEVLRPYLQDGLNLIAFRLQKTAMSGSIRPVRITYDAEQPFIPIRPTAVAANDDMGIMVWVVSASRAIPATYKSLELNEAAINWFSPMGTYNDVVSAAADEAGGQGFVTEQAGPTDALKETVVFSYERDQWNQLQNSGVTDAIDLFNQTMNSFMGWDGFPDVLREVVMLPAEVPLEDFLNCPRCYADTPGVVIDTTAMLKELYEKVIKPMFDTADLLQSQKYVTRMYTTMSADEMSVDPSFDFNPDLEDVSNVHTADQFIKCDGSWIITLPQGDAIHGTEMGVWPTDLGDQPAARKILQLTTEGDGEVVEDNSDKIVGLLKDNGPQPAPGDPLPGSIAGSTGSTAGMGVATASGNSCGCRVPGGAQTHAAMPSLLLGLAFAARLVRRRSRRTQR